MYGGLRIGWIISILDQYIAECLYFYCKIVAKIAKSETKKW